MQAWASLSADDQRRRAGLIALVIVQVLFGLFAVFVKLTTDPGGGFAPRAVAFWRIAAGALVLGSLALLRFRAGLLPERSELARLFCLGMFGVVINQVLALEGVTRTSATMAGILMVLIPVFTYALAIAVKQEEPQPRRALGIAVALLGALFLIFSRSAGRSLGGGSNPLLGDLFILLNCLSYASFLILARRVLSSRPALWVIAWTFLMSLTALPFLSIGVDLWPADLTQRALCGLALLISLSTILAYLLNTFALARVSASTAASFIFLQPLVAGAAAWVVIGERPTLMGLWPVALLFLGLWLVISRRAISKPKQV